jgi:hypothetical protein
MSKLVTVVLSSLLVPASVLAHPGHGEPGEGWTVAHYVAEPLHLLAAVGLVAVFAGGAAIVAHRLRGAAADLR